MRIVVKKSIIGLIMVVICFTGCGKRIECIPDFIFLILNQSGIYSAQINKLCDYSRYKLDYTSLSTESFYISDGDVKEYIEFQMESYAQLIEVTDRKEAREGDVVVVSYEVVVDKKVVNRVTQDMLMIGSGNYDQQFEET